MKATRRPPDKVGMTEFVVEADEDEAAADEILRQVYAGINHPEKRCQVQITRVRGIGWRVTVRRSHIGVTTKDPHGDELAVLFAKLDRKARPER
mgnify:CR=1 FL=1